MTDYSTAITVQVDPGHYQRWADGSKVLWHFLVPAASPREAIQVLRRDPRLNGMQMRVVPRLG